MDAAVGQVQVDQWNLLGVRGQNEVAGLQVARAVAGNQLDIALDVQPLRRVRVEPEADAEDQDADDADQARSREGPAEQKQQRSEEDREVTRHPDALDLRDRPRERDHRDEEAERHPRGALGRTPALTPREEQPDRGDDRDQADLAKRAEQRARDLLRRAPGRPVRPRRAGVLELVQRGRQPRQVKNAGAAEAEQCVAHERAPLERPAPGEHRDRHDRGEHEERRPEMRVDERDERDREPRDVAPVPEHEHVQEAGRAEQAEQDDERVHPRLLRVRRQERVARAHDR